MKKAFHSHHPCRDSHHHVAVWRTTPAPQYPAAAIHSALPDPSTAKLALNSMSRHREWVMAPSEAGGVLAFVVYPERSDKAP